MRLCALLRLASRARRRTLLRQIRDRTGESEPESEDACALTGRIRPGACGPSRQRSSRTHVLSDQVREQGRAWRTDALQCCCSSLVIDRRTSSNCMRLCGWRPKSLCVFTTSK